MKKVRNYILALVIMIVGSFLVSNYTLKAEEVEEEEIDYKEVLRDSIAGNEDALKIMREFIVFNPNSSGNPSYVYNVEVSNGAAGETITEKKQFTKSRDIGVEVNFPQEIYSELGETFKICETIDDGTALGKENCIEYAFEDEDIKYQIMGKSDGDKVLTFQTSNLKIKKTITLDTTGPVITLNGGEYIYIPLGEQYEEQEASCVDNSGVVLGECIVNVEEANIDMNKSTYQYVRYTATDFLGNESNVVRKILVEIEEEESTNITFWIGAGIGIAILSAFLFLQVWKNKEKQKNQSVL